MADPQNFNDLMLEYLKQKNKNSLSKPMKQKLSVAQMDSLNNRLKILMPQFKKAINEKSLLNAKTVISDLQPVLRSLNKTTKLVEVKNQFFELALEEQEHDLAIDGFLSNRRLISNTTRLHLEATALLAIAYLRKNEIEKAKPFIKEVLQNKNVIKTERTREKFNKEIIARFDEECALVSLKTDKKIELNVDKIYEDVNAVNSLTDKQLYSLIGKALPKLTKALLFEVDKFSKNQLTYEEQKFLPSSEEIIKDEQAGRTVFSAFKSVVYKSLCDPSSEVYKIWYSNMVGVVIDKKYITTAIAVALTGSGIGIMALIISRCFSFKVWFGHLL